MSFKIALAALPLVAVALPAAAQTSFYIVQDSASKHCSVVDARPTTREMTIVGPNGVIYKTQAEAETAMRTVTVCH